MSDTTPEGVAAAVARWHGYASHMPESNAKALLLDACDLIEALARERDLAVAHDRQPYPTAEAYELVCASRDDWQARAERAEAALRTRIDAEYRAAFATDDAARARLADERAGIAPTERDRRGVDLGVGAGQRGGA